MKSKFSSPTQKQESSPEGKLELNYNTPMINNQNVPKLRFKEFSGEWEEKTLGEVAGKIGDGLHGTPLYSDNSDIYFINGNNLTNGKIEINENTKKVDHEIFKKNDKSLNNNTLLISLNGTIGNIAKYNNEKVMLSKSVGYFNFKENTDFYYHVLNTKTIQNFFISELTGSTIKNLSLKTLRETEISFPSLPEQQKIASFLSAIDTKITLRQAQGERLKQYKKGVMQKIFSQELRFKADDGSEFPEWEEKTIDDCITESKIKGDTGDKAKKLTVKLWNKGVFAKNEIISGSENTQYYIRKAGQFIYSKLDFLNCAFGIIPENLDGYQSTIDLPCFEFINCTNPLFFLSRVSRKDFYLHFGEQADGSRKARRINQNIFLEMPILLPSVDEQTKIANFLSALDTKIDLVAKQLDVAKNFKKALLQQMFV